MLSDRAEHRGHRRRGPPQPVRVRTKSWTEGGISSRLAKHMRDALPNASFIGFTGTPIETTDKNTRAVFGDYIDVYDIQRAVEDGATVPIYYESRLAKLDLKDELKAEHRRRVRGGHRGGGSEPEGEAQDQVGAPSKPWSAARSASTWSPRTSSSTSSPAATPWRARRWSSA